MPESAAAGVAAASDNEDDEFEKELDAMEAASRPIPTESDFDSLVAKMIDLGRVKGKAVWEVIDHYPLEIQESCRIVSAMPLTQVSVERLFSALKIIRSDTRTRIKEHLLQSILFLRVNKQKADNDVM